MNNPISLVITCVLKPFLFQRLSCCWPPLTNSFYPLLNIIDTYCSCVLWLCCARWLTLTQYVVCVQVDDQMKLLQHSWSDMLVLDHMHQRMHNNLPDETTLPNGQKFDLLSLGLLGVPSLADHFTEITHLLQELKFDLSDYICVKFLLLLNPGTAPLQLYSFFIFI